MNWNLWVAKAAFKVANWLDKIGLRFHARNLKSIPLPKNPLEYKGIYYPERNSPLVYADERGNKKGDVYAIALNNPDPTSSFELFTGLRVSHGDSIVFNGKEWDVIQRQLPNRELRIDGLMAPQTWPWDK